mmetsp:Transcript_98025/g.280449  ORF Transcript_98025/g.280449 Transcript_98025/m.280449 type:complete len:490 (-) Transcript_98025:1165-2634(-)|eukprot:CAMPEP_0119489530 /NCGR_PEP_ID=MMETSP1344-20130328/14959_1 /TAXON_ID=236787 /ORGANISM="Florenciella parvula, Strain CCMP2471" /LENGTH=489 /DNA_ID=CAMNT_0007524591 /DNA_START=148 /DNA_END=1617 /DNA_ORIENTATION=-
MAYKPGGTYSKFVLYVLLLVYISNQWCRYLLNYLYAVADMDEIGPGDPKGGNFQSMARATHITNSQYGILAGFAFHLSYVSFGLITGRITNQCNRRTLIILGLLIWNGATVLLGTATSFPTLLAARIILGIGEAFSAPASYSLIADYFPSEGRGEANGIYAIGVYVGGGLSSLSIAMSQEVGWRMTCQITAAYGVMLMIVVMCMIREPIRVHGRRNKQSGAVTGGPRKPSLMEAVCEICKSRLCCLLFAASSVRFMGTYVFAAFLPRFYAITFPEENMKYSYISAAVVSFGGALSSFLGGRVVDRWEKSGQPAARLYAPILGTLVGLPFMALMLLSPNFNISVVGLMVEYLLAECWFAPVISVLQSALPYRVRSHGIGIFTFITALSGSTAVWAVGYFMDKWTLETEGGARNLRLLLLGTMSIVYLVCAILFYCASRILARPMSAAAAIEKQPLFSQADQYDRSKTQYVQSQAVSQAIMGHNKSVANYY